MKLKLWFLTTTAVAMTLALLGFLRDVNTTRATMPLPVQPFASKSIGGINTTQLGQKITEDRVVAQALKGERTNSPWIFSGPGFSVDLDKETADGKDLGTVEAEIDVGCDGFVDHLYDDCATGTPLHWLEATTVVQGTPDDFLIAGMPPYSWLLRQKADITHVCFGTGTATSISVLNTIYTTIPFSPSGGAGVAATLLGGAPNGPPSLVCLDSPNTSVSISSTVTNPQPQSDLDGVCNPAVNQCADAGIYGMWTDNTVQINGPFPNSAVITIQKHLVNNGPMPGYFREHWDAESTNANIGAEWTNGLPTLNQDLVLPLNLDVTPPMQAQISCAAQGWGLVVLKNILWPLPGGVPPALPLNTKDTYLDDNAMTFVVLVKCGNPATIPPVDKEVAYIKTLGPDHILAPSLPPGVPGIPVPIDELKENHSTNDHLAGQEWLVAEPSPELTVSWAPGVSVSAAGKTTQTPTVTGCADSGHPGDACIKFQVDEWMGQADVNAQLFVACTLAAPPGLYPVVIKGIDLPLVGFESKPSDNAQRKVITVRCGAPATDGIDDAAGLYPRWTIYKSIGASQFGEAGDLRKPYQSPPSFASDTGYVERVVQLECVWMDTNGCGAETGTQCDNATDDDGDGVVNDGCPAAGPLVGDPPAPAPETGAQCSNAIDDDGDGFVNDGCPVAGPNCDANHDGVISAEESWNDPDLLAIHNGTDVGIDAIDKDRDCLMAPAFAQPGHPVDPEDTPRTGAGANCPAVPYSVNPVSVVYNKAADQDCDGLVDGIEKAWGSNPLVADSDADGAPDFVEMFQFTTPVNPDTDGDGLLDKAENNYVSASVPSLQCAAQCANNTDDDGDGFVNDGCPAAGTGLVPAPETGVQCNNNTDDDADGVVNDGCIAVGPAEVTNNWDDDGDGKVNDGCPAVPGPGTTGAETGTQCADNVDSDGDGYVNDGCPTVATIAEGTTGGEKGEAANLDDNCPSVANPDQKNSDGLGRDNGPNLANVYTSNPNADKLGDACDSDSDNDQATDLYEIAKGTNPLLLDSDGDTINDGAELRLASGTVDPLNPAKKPAWTNVQQVYYRGCHINVNTTDYPAFAPYIAGPDGAEMDVDGDGVVCPTDTDSDNGHGNQTEIQDKYEAYGYNLSISSPDTDGDGCDDWVEIMDINGDRTADSGDQGRLNRRVSVPQIIPNDPVSDLVFDVNKDGFVDSGDQGAMNRNVCSGTKNWGGCATGCPPDQ